jgi:hypothetical protein
MGKIQGLASKLSVINRNTQNKIFCVFRVWSAKQATSTAQLCGTRYNFRKVSPKSTSATAINIGRYGSRAVKWAIHAPPMPRLRSNSGPTQQADAPIPAKMPPIRAVLVFSTDLKQTFLA